MELGQENLKIGLLLGIFLAMFFLVGFYLGGGVSTGRNNVTDASGSDSDSQGAEVTQEEAIGKVKNYLESGPLSYPFAYNLSTKSVGKVEDIEGAEFFYNLTIGFTVEPNPFNSGIWEFGPVEV